MFASPSKQEQEPTQPLDDETLLYLLYRIIVPGQENRQKRNTRCPEYAY